MHPNSVAKLSVCILCQQKRTLCITVSRALGLFILKTPSYRVCSFSGWIALLCSNKMLGFLIYSAFALLGRKILLVQIKR